MTLVRADRFHVVGQLIERLPLVGIIHSVEDLPSPPVTRLRIPAGPLNAALPREAPKP